MKRSAYDEDGECTLVAERPSVGAAIEKRARSGSPPMVVGPLVFNSEGTALKQSLLAAEPSSLPGVHRLAASASAVVRLWSPQWIASEFLETGLAQVLEAIDGKCIFIFDTRAHAGEPLLQGLVAVDGLLSLPAVQRWAVFVSTYEPGEEAAAHRIPFIQDPASALASLCRFYAYLGPSAVCVKNGEVVATTMLTRTPDALYTTFEDWSSI